MKRYTFLLTLLLVNCAYFGDPESIGAVSKYDWRDIGPGATSYQWHQVSRATMLKHCKATVWEEANGYACHSIVDSVCHVYSVGSEADARSMFFTVGENFAAHEIEGHCGIGGSGRHRTHSPVN